MLPKFLNPTKFFRAPLLRLFDGLTTLPVLFRDFLFAGRFSTPPLVLSIESDRRRAERGLKLRLLLGLLFASFGVKVSEDLELFLRLIRADLRRSSLASGVSLMTKSSHA